MGRKLKERGSKGFSQEYWKANYNRPGEMDGIANASQHALYLKALFDVEFVDISSIIDFGFGLGYLFEEVLKTFIPYRAEGIEPSSFAFNEVLERSISPAESTRLKLRCIDLMTWSNNLSRQKKKGKRFDLGICTSVFQYLTDEEIEKVLPTMANQVRYLYFSVPTKRELERQGEELDFEDKYAIRRSQRKYLRMLKPHFTFIGSRVLESKVYFDEDNTLFTDLLFRF